MKNCYFHSVDMPIHYQTEGHGEPFICLPGGRGNSGDYFFPFLSPLADTFQMVYLDERGSGKSKPVPDRSRISYEGIAADIENLIVYLGAPQVALLGHSWGSLLAMYFTLRYPQRVRELYLVGGAVTYKEIQAWWGSYHPNQLKRLGIADLLPPIADLYNTGQISADESFRRTVIAQAPAVFYHWDTKRAIIQDVLRRTDFTYLGPDKANWIEPDLLSRLPEIKCPTLIIVGQHEVSVPIEMFGPMARLIPTSELRVIPRARHFPFIDEPELTVAAIRQFHVQYDAPRR